jgi:NAD(P)H-dependent flavin oxidoreductase YrpB (nitropropane dioxygenase family)
MTGPAELRALLNLEVALVQGPMRGVAGPRLVSAVSNAGALGVLPIWAAGLEGARKQIRATVELTDRAFAVNLRADLQQLDHATLALDEGITLFHLFWGDPVRTASHLDTRGGKFIATIGDSDAAKKALDAGAIALVAQGVEAGGHVLSNMPLEELLPAAVAEAGLVPVIAAGGVAIEADVQSVLNLGASAVLCGSRFVASVESDAHDAYKQAIVLAGSNATDRSLCFDIGWPDAPHRTLINETLRRWDAAGRPPMGERPGEGEILFQTAAGADVPRYFVSPPAVGMRGEVTEGAMYAGTGVSRIEAVLPAAEIVRAFSPLLG